METEINLKGRCSGRIKDWVISILSSVFMVGSLVACRRDFVTIDGVDVVVNLAEIMPEGIQWFIGFFIIAAICILPVLRGLQIAFGSLAYGMLVFVLVDQGAQFRALQEMGTIPESLMEHMKISWAGWLMAATTAGFLLVIGVEAVMRILCRRK